jgi:hypothetical protein
METIDFTEECKRRQLRAWLDRRPLVGDKAPPIAAHIVTQGRLAAVGCSFEEARRAMAFVGNPWNEGLTLNSRERDKRVADLRDARP